MKKHFLFIVLLNFLFYFNHYSHASGPFIVNQGNLVFNNNVHFVANGSLVLSSGTTFIDNSDEHWIHISMNLNSTANHHIDFNRANVRMHTPSLSNIALLPSFNATFRRLVIDKTLNGNLSLGSSIYITREVDMVSGLFDLMNSNLILRPGSIVSNETNFSRIHSSDGINLGMGLGRIVLDNYFLNPGMNINIAGIGLDVYSNNYIGAKTISRGHQFIWGTATPSVQSVHRNFILPEFGEIKSDNFLQVYYFRDEINSHNEQQLMVFQEVVCLSSGNQDFAPLNTNLNSLQQPPLTLFSTSPFGYYVNNVNASLYNLNSGFFTIGSLNMPLPIDLTYFNVICKNNHFILNWETASETNNDYFIIEKKIDNFNFGPYKIIDGQGTVNQKTNYSTSISNLNNFQNVYFRLKQVDFDGKYKIYPPIKAKCDEFFNKFLIYQDENSNVIVEFFSEQITDFVFVLHDHQGRLIFTKKGTTELGYNKKIFQINNLNFSIYHASLLLNNNKFSRKIVLN